MTLDTAQSMSLLVIAFLAVAILLRILTYVHRQNRHVNELELRMSAIEQMSGEGKLPVSNKTITESKGE